MNICKNFSENELNKLIEWFNAVQDLNSSYLEKQDYILAKGILETLNRRVPDSILIHTETTSDNTEILPCPFCGSAPEFPEVSEVDGTCYEGGCNDCGKADIYVQIIDCFEYSGSPSRDEVNNSWKDNRYDNKYISVARKKAIDEWNTRK